MPSVFVSVPQFPDVPDLPGVPPLPRQATNALTAITSLVGLLTGDASSILGQAMAQGPQWGVFDTSNNPLITPDSIFSFSLADDARIEKYPIEGGSFQSYNKVNQPFEPRVTMTQGGSVSDRTTFIQALRALKVSIAVCNIVTPEITYESVNCTHVDFDRKAGEGATLIKAELHFEQVNQTASVAFSNTAQPSGAGQSNGGQVQAVAPNAVQTTAAADGAS